MEILEIWKVMDITKDNFTQGFIDEIAFYGQDYEDLSEVREHLYNADGLLEDAENEIIDITAAEKEMLLQIKKLQEENDCFYFRIVNI